LLDFLFGGQLRLLAIGILEEEKDGNHRDCADGKVDVEAPTPADTVCQRATQKRS